MRCKTRRAAEPNLRDGAGNRVIGYYSLAPASVAPEDAPARVMKGQARYPVPVILMARFAVDHSEQGKGWEKRFSGMPCAARLQGADAIGGRAFLVHAKDEDARAFYRKFGMEASPTNALHRFRCFKIFAGLLTPQILAKLPLTLVTTRAGGPRRREPVGVFSA